MHGTSAAGAGTPRILAENAAQRSVQSRAWRPTNSIASRFASGTSEMKFNAPSIDNPHLFNFKTNVLTQACALSEIVSDARPWQIRP